MITLRTKRSGNALLVVASRFVRDVTIINNNLATSKSIILCFYVVSFYVVTNRTTGYIVIGFLAASWP